MLFKSGIWPKRAERGAEALQVEGSIGEANACAYPYQDLKSEAKTQALPELSAPDQGTSFSGQGPSIFLAKYLRRYGWRYRYAS